MKNEEKQGEALENFSEILPSLIFLYKTNEYIDPRSEQYNLGSRIFDIVPELEIIQQNARSKVI